MEKQEKIILTTIIALIILMVLVNTTNFFLLSLPITQSNENKTKELKTENQKTNIQVNSSTAKFNTIIKAEAIKTTKMKALKLFDEIKECPFIQEYKIKIVNEGSFRIEKPIIEFKGIKVNKCINCNVNVIEKELIVSFYGCKKEEKAAIEIRAVNAQAIQLNFT